MEDIIEEIEAIEAIYCGEKEFCWHNKGVSSAEFSVTTSPLANPELKMTIVFTLSTPSYPKEPPLISVQCSSLTRMECDKAKTFLKEVADSRCGTPMVLDLLTALQGKGDITGTLKNSAKMLNNTHKECSTCVLQLDHMRNKTRYLKKIKAWCEELSLGARIVFCLQWIFIILQGYEENIKTYIQRNKTQCVDVDSSGRACKERLMSVLYQGDQENRFVDVEIRHIESISDFQEWMTRFCLSNLFEDVIAPVISKRF